MKNFRAFLVSAFVAACFGVFGLTSCAENALMPQPQGITAVQKSAKSTGVATNSITSLNSSQQPSEQINNFGVLRAFLSLNQATANSDNSVTIQFSVRVYSPDGDDSFSVSLFRTVTDISGNVVSGPTYFGDYYPGSYSATSPMGLPPGTYFIRLTTQSPVARSGTVQVTIP